MTATFYVGDAIQVMNTLSEKSVDLVLTSPPFLALRSYLPQDHPVKALEGGSQATPGAYIDWLLDVVEACARVLAPHGSLCFELGDTYSGSGGAGGDYAEDGLRDGQAKFRQQRVTPDLRRSGNAAEWAMNDGTVQISGGRGWPQAKSLSLIPETFRWAMVYGHNPHTGRKTEPWRLRNVIRWVRPNPPVGALGDKFRPATSELMVFCKAKDRFFDLDAVREAPGNGQRNSLKSWDNAGKAEWGTREHTGFRGWHDEPVDSARTLSHPSGAPPLDWWNIPPGGYDGAHYAVFPKELLIKPIKAMCPAFVCTACGLVLASVYDQAGSGSAESLRRMRPSDRAAVGEVARGRKEHAVLLGGLPESSHGTESGIDQRLDSESEGLHPHTGAATSNGESRGLRDAASVGDVGILGAVTQSRGSGSSQERGEGRQPVGEFGIVDEGGSRPITEAGTETPRVSSLWRVDSNATECPACGGVLRSGTVLDPFAGSGTTLSVATGHGRDAIGIDLDERNFELALDRVGPLVLERGGVAA